MTSNYILRSATAIIMGLCSMGTSAVTLVYHYEGVVTSVSDQLAGGPISIGQTMSADLLIDSTAPIYLSFPEYRYTRYLAIRGLNAKIGTAAYSWGANNGQASNALSVTLSTLGDSSNSLLAQSTVLGPSINGHSPTVFSFEITAPAGTFIDNSIPSAAPSFDSLNSPKWFLAMRRPGNSSGWTVSGVITAFAIRALEVVDPVGADSNGLLLAGNLITTDVERLATQGRKVGGVAADGVAQVVVRFPASSVGQVFSIDLKPNVCSTAGVACQESYGRLFDVFAQSEAIYSNAATGTSIQVTARATSKGPMAFFGYRAPSDFVRTDSVQNRSVDEEAGVRAIDLIVQSGTSIPLTLQVVRPPVIAVHGLWADSTRASLADLLDLADGRRFRLTVASYGDKEFAVAGALTTPRSILPTVKGGALGFRFGAGELLKQMISEHADFRLGANPANIPIASGMYDVVAHSMGNLVVRTMVTKSVMPAATRGRGYVHKLISVGGPHLGSPFALELTKPENNCIRTIVSAASGGVFGDCDDCVTAYTATVGGTIAYKGSGAVGDLSGSGDGSVLSRALSGLRSSSIQVPTAYISGIMSDAQIDSFLAPAPTNKVCQSDNPNVCFNMPTPRNNIQLLRGCSTLGDSLPSKIGTPTAFRTLMSPKNDGVVPLTSQQNGLISYPIAPLVGYLHSPGTASLFQFYGLPEPTELSHTAATPSWNISKLVAQYLNVPVVDSNVFNAKAMGAATK